MSASKARYRSPDRPISAFPPVCKMKVWGVNAGRIATTYEDGVLSFTVGDEENPAAYYLIVKE